MNPPAAVGLPPITPVLALIERPAGRAPPPIDQWYGGVPPAPLTVTGLYPMPTSPTCIEKLLMISCAGGVDPGGLAADDGVDAGVSCADDGLPDGLDDALAWVDELLDGLSWAVLLPPSVHAAPESTTAAMRAARLKSTLISVLRILVQDVRDFEAVSPRT